MVFSHLELSSNWTNLINFNIKLFQFIWRGKSQAHILKLFKLQQIWRRGVVVLTGAQVHSTKSELRFCAGANPACGVSESCDGENL